VAALMGEKSRCSVEAPEIAAITQNVVDEVKAHLKWLDR
jgi:hypothetical protein